MSDDDNMLKLHIHYGGLMSTEGDKICYVDGLIAPDMVVDPDFLTFSIFEDFTRNREVVSDVKKVWYRLPNEDMSMVKSIWEDKDSEIMKMALEAKDSREVYIYIEHESPPKVVEGGNSVTGNEPIEDCLDDGEKADDEEDNDAEDKEEEESDGDNPEADTDEEEIEDEVHREEEGGVQSEDEFEILAEGAPDLRFGNFLNSVETEMPTVLLEPPPALNIDDEEAADSEVETEKPIPTGEYPDSPEDTDEEWHNWQKKDDRGRRFKGKSKADYDKPPYLWLMQTFTNGDEFKDQLLRYVLKTQYDVKLNKWQPTKYAAICTHEKCKWRIYCSLEKPIRKWMVKVYEDNHNHLPTGRARMLQQGTIARLFKEEVRRRPDIRSSDIKDELMHRYNISVSIYKCRKARRIALDMVLDTQKQQFAKLWDYETELIRSNENVTTEIVTVEKDGVNVFESFYICFEPLRRIWKKNCRPLIGLDGAFLKWQLKGEILSAVGRDAENRIYPIAWAVVRGENKDSWEWFMKKLTDDLNLGVGDGVTFISDKQKGLKVALATVLPNAEHRNCAKHVYGNWKKKYGDLDYKPFFWNVAYSKTKGEYDLHIEALKAYDVAAHDDLLAADPTTWCLAFFSGNARSAQVCNSLSESFNKTIKGARELPLINMLESIRRQAMMRISRRLKKARACILPFPKKVADVLELSREKSNDCTILISSDNLFEVLLYNCGYEVSLRLRHCACREWDLTGIPCPHAICVINDNHQQPEKTITCGNCKKTGHNRGTCKDAAFVIQGPARKRGRPRKIQADGCINPPKRRKTNLSQPSNPQSTPNQSQASTQPSNTAPQPTTRTQSQSQSASSTVPTGRGRGRRGRPPGRGQARKVTVPRGVGVYMCPFSDRVFECFGPTSREVEGSSSHGPKSRT